MTVTIPGCHIEANSEGYLVATPSRDGGVNRALFERAVTLFLQDNLDYEVIGEPHRSSQDGHLDHVILKPPA